jgi:dolichol-phosphate mannosyltransferase
MAAWEFGVLILDKLIGRVVPVRFFAFAVIGGTGLLVHLATMGLVFAAGGGFTTAQVIAVVVAMTWNFVLNNVITYRDQRLKGRDIPRGLITFYAIGAVGALANIGIAEAVFASRPSWWIAGLAGAIVGVVWNFTMSSFLTWRRQRPE